MYTQKYELQIALGLYELEYEERRNHQVHNHPERQAYINRTLEIRQGPSARTIQAYARH